MSIPPSKASPAFPYLLGLIPGLLAIGLLVSSIRFKDQAAHAPGLILSMDVRRGNKGGYTYAPYTRFVDASGRTIFFVSRVHTNLVFWPPVGSTVEVLYDPQNPSRARLHCFAGLWLAPVMSGVFSLFFFLIGGFIWMGNRKKTTPQPPLLPPSPGASQSGSYDVPTIIR